MFQPNRGVNPSRQESIQHIDTASHVRLCVARDLYLRDQTKRNNEKDDYFNQLLIKHLIHKAVLLVNQCSVPHLSGMCNRRYRSTAIASNDSTEAWVSTSTTQLRSRHMAGVKLTQPSNITARGTAATPTRKSATAKETRKQKVGSLRESRRPTHTAHTTSMLPKQQATEISTSTTV